MDQPFPWFTENNPVRVGAAVTFPQARRHGVPLRHWKLQPQTRVTDARHRPVAFEQDRPAQPGTSAAT